VNEILRNMLDIIRAVVGTGGPLLVEYKGRVLSESCMIITEKHANNMIKRLESLKINYIEQTSDRSFSVSFK
jgi:hypothetical protein